MMKRYLKFLFAAAFIMTAIIIDPPPGNPTGKPQSSKRPIPGQPPIIIFFPGGSN